MATAEQIKALIKSHLSGDEEQFRTVALQVAAHAARHGHGQVATELKHLLDAARTARRATAPTPIVTPKGELSGLLAVSYPKTRLSDMVLSEDIDVQLRRLLREQRSRQKLEAHGLSPRRKLLLVGPPGSGKTMTASAIAGELHLPLYVIVFDSLITKFMGETAAKLRLVFDAMNHQRGVYLFDEFDAIGAHRSSPNDVGEIRRVLNSFLQFLEQDASPSLVLAATNHPEALDRALFRRFDDVIQYALPPRALVERAVRNRLASFDLGAIVWDEVAAAADGLSYADLAQAADAAAKQAVLDDAEQLDTSELVKALEERRVRHQAL